MSFASVAGKKNKTTGTMTVRGVAWDQTLGGWLFDQARAAAAPPTAPPPYRPAPLPYAPL